MSADKTIQMTLGLKQLSLSANTFVYKLVRHGKKQALIISFKDQEIIIKPILTTKSNTAAAAKAQMFHFYSFANLKS